MNEKYPFVSVIIPTLNEEKYIEATLLSIRNQDYKGKYEIIVVDSNSKDRTVEIARKYADKVIVTKRKGVSAGRNIGARVARGEILLFVDADTILLPNVISKIVNHLKKKNIVGVVVPVLSDDFTKNILYTIGDWINYLLSKNNLHLIHAICFGCKRDAFFRVGGFNEQLHVAEDIELGSRIKKIGKVEYIKDTFVITSSRRIKKWSIFKQLNAWPLGYFYFKIFGYQPKYPPIR
ncbi:MAG: glycosyltransferase [Candidatus Aenigmarchaeota archaeon]|nr:glycosyltransferase [Candidatus Aenigmarchaeota archaeon]